MEGIYEKVNGVNVSKLGYESFEDTVKNFDIICLQETHICPSESIVIPKTFTSIPPIARSSTTLWTAPAPLLRQLP